MRLRNGSKAIPGPFSKARDHFNSDSEVALAVLERQQLGANQFEGANLAHCFTSSIGVAAMPTLVKRGNGRHLILARKWNYSKWPPGAFARRAS